MASRACRLRPSEKYSFLMEAHSFLGNAVRAGTPLSGWSLITINLWIKTQIINITQHKRSNNTIFYSYHIHTIVFNMWHSNCSSRKGQKRKKYIRASYARISQDIIKLFVHYVNCISNRKVWQTAAKTNYQSNKSKPFPWSCASGYNDFRTLPRESQFGHKWLPHIMDHFSKYSWLLANNKKVDLRGCTSPNKPILDVWFPIHPGSENGKEFQSKNISELCKKHKIWQVHGAPQTLSTKGLVEKNNHTVKENSLHILTERCESLVKWCFVVSEAAHKKNISEHRAISQVPYDIVFGIFPRKEMPAVMEQRRSHWAKWANDNHVKRSKVRPFWSPGRVKKIFGD